MISEQFVYQKVKPNNEWYTCKPPNQIPVEVELKGEIVVVEAFYGRDGYKPHWRHIDGRCWNVLAFSRWRHIINER